MQDIKEAASAFLANKRVAVTGVSRTPKSHGSNTVYRRLRDRGYEVFAVEPERRRGRGGSLLPGSEVDPGRCRGGRDRNAAGDRRGHDARVRRARHRARLDASGPERGQRLAGRHDYGRQHGITVIDGGCPLMFGPTADFGHKVMRLVYAGHVPKQV